MNSNEFHQLGPCGPSTEMGMLRVAEPSRDLRPPPALGGHASEEVELGEAVA